MHKRVLLLYGDRIKDIFSRAIRYCREGFSGYFRIENNLKNNLAIFKLLKIKHLHMVRHCIFRTRPRELR